MLPHHWQLGPRVERNEGAVATELALAGVLAADVIQRQGHSARDPEGWPLDNPATLSTNILKVGPCLRGGLDLDVICVDRKKPGVRGCVAADADPSFLVARLVLYKFRHLRLIMNRSRFKSMTMHRQGQYGRSEMDNDPDWTVDDDVDQRIITFTPRHPSAASR